MKAMTMIRMQVIAAGLGAALVCTASVKAQEITNTDWPNPNTVAMTQQAQASTPEAAKTAAGAQVAAAPAKVAAEGVATSDVRVSREAGWVIGSMAVCLGLALYALPMSKREMDARVRRARMLNGQAVATRS